jgi:hypothetical protein
MKRKKVVSKTIRSEIFHYALPPFLLGVISQKDYCDWLQRKGHNLRQGDTKLKRPYAKENTVMVYKQKIHQAVLDGGEFDPYTGEKINWGLISKEKNLKKGDYIDNYLNRYAMYPAVDHIIPGEFEFEICSWISNESKSSMTPDEFVDFCRKVVSFRGPRDVLAQLKAAIA